MSDIKGLEVPRGFKGHWHQVKEKSELERWVEVIEQEVQIPEPVRGGSVSADTLDGQGSA